MDSFELVQCIIGQNCEMPTVCTYNINIYEIYVLLLNMLKMWCLIILHIMLDCFVRVSIVVHQHGKVGTYFLPVFVLFLQKCL